MRTACVWRLCAVLLPCAVGVAQAQSVSYRPSVYLQAGRAGHSADSRALGGQFPWQHWQRPFASGVLRGQWDISLDRWDFDTAFGRSRHALLLTVVPVLRFIPHGGHSRWFWEAGIGGSLASRRYVLVYKGFSTRANFASHLAVGIRLGSQQQHELALRVQHFSNAGIKTPNPGENFVQWRYARYF